MTWIELKQQKPKQYGVYLACDDTEVWIAGYWDFGWGVLNSCDEMRTSLYWMPIPPPPYMKS